MKNLFPENLPNTASANGERLLNYPNCRIKNRWWQWNEKLKMENRIKNYLFVILWSIICNNMGERGIRWKIEIKRNIRESARITHPRTPNLAHRCRYFHILPYWLFDSHWLPLPPVYNRYYSDARRSERCPAVPTSRAATASTRSPPISFPSCKYNYIACFI